LDERGVAGGVPDLSAERADLRTLVATAARVLAVAGLFDMHGHISVREYTADEIARVRAGLAQRSVSVKTWTDALERARVAGRLEDLD
jgi:hypothetical protein